MKIIKSDIDGKEYTYTVSGIQKVKRSPPYIFLDGGDPVPIDVKQDFLRIAFELFPEAKNHLYPENKALELFFE
jgi:hypothetical protein